VYTQRETSQEPDWIAPINIYSDCECDVWYAPHYDAYEYPYYKPSKSVFVDTVPANTPTFVYFKDPKVEERFTEEGLYGWNPYLIVPHGNNPLAKYEIIGGELNTRYVANIATGEIDTTALDNIMCLPNQWID
jgi:hypothetical protein